MALAMDSQSRRPVLENRRTPPGHPGRWTFRGHVVDAMARCFSAALPDYAPWDRFHATVILLLGGFGDVFGGLESGSPFPWWLRLFSLLLTLTGIAPLWTSVRFDHRTSVIHAVSVPATPPARARQNHIVIVGQGAWAGGSRAFCISCTGRWSSLPTRSDPNISPTYPSCREKSPMP